MFRLVISSGGPECTSDQHISVVFDSMVARDLCNTGEIRSVDIPDRIKKPKALSFGFWSLLAGCAPPTMLSISISICCLYESGIAVALGKRFLYVYQAISQSLFRFTHVSGTGRVTVP